MVDGIRIATLCGEIDHDGRDIPREALLPTGEPVLPVVAGMSGVTFMDSSALDVLLRASRQISRAQGRLRIAAPAPSVRRVPAPTGADTVIGCHPTLADALNAWHQERTIEDGRPDSPGRPSSIVRSWCPGAGRRR
ncbi:STAS domain-containing protein [Streptomyces bikiniensis]|uniref:STAS domain-containing protein n=1 Tax=Streptomyces bikiniensis TaxID=1896 RepID=A0ABW8CZW4_STRBI